MPTVSSREVEAGDRGVMITYTVSLMEANIGNTVRSHLKTKQVLNNHLATDQHCNASTAQGHPPPQLQPPKTNHSAWEEGVYIVHWPSTQIPTTNPPRAINTGQENSHT